MSRTRIAPTTAHLMAMPVCTSVSQLSLVEVAVHAHGRIAPQDIVVIIIDVTVHLSLFERETHRSRVFEAVRVSMKGGVSRPLLARLISNR